MTMKTKNKETFVGHETWFEDGYRKILDFQTCLNHSSVLPKQTAVIYVFVYKT